MRFSSDDKNIRKMQLKKFHELAGKQLLAKGFKKKNHTYYRIFGDELFQVISFGWLSMRNYELHFSIIPLYGNYIGINVSPTPFDEWASIPISFAIGGTRDFNLQLKYLCDVMYPDAFLI